jgi:peptidoglycan/xylan/chitin deacetylase (PgdA/CDA1 family)
LGDVVKKRLAFALALATVPALASIAGAPSAAAREPASRSVAITFDDLPFAHANDAAAGDDAAVAVRASSRILDALRRHSAPATGFVNEAKVEKLGDAGIAILKSWNRGAFDLGNHGFSHADSNALSLAQVAQEIDDGEATIGPLAEAAGRSLRFFRFPFNHVGDSEERRVGIEKLLEDRGYRLAASTIDTSDYLFDQAYERALSIHDATKQRAIETAYLDYTRQQVDYYAGLNTRVLGYEPPEVMLLHLNRLNAAVIDRLLGIFEDLGYAFVSLQTAQSDPAYRNPPVFATEYGPMWGYRWARERKVKVNGRLEQEPPAWISRYAHGK